MFKVNQDSERRQLGQSSAFNVDFADFVQVMFAGK